MNQEQLKVKLEEFKGKAQQRWDEFKVNELPVIQEKGKEAFATLKNEIEKVVAKFTKDKYLQASIGLVFKIGSCKTPDCTVAPKSKEAEDALQHLRGIINK